MNSKAQRFTLTAIHFTSILIVLWIYFGIGKQTVFNVFGETDNVLSDTTKLTLSAFMLVYFSRFLITTFVLLKRQMPWNEVFEVGLFIASIQISFACLAIYNKVQFENLDWLFSALFVIGSYLNTASEWQRMIWKKDSQNKGKLYTIGLFKYSMHINYFGDMLSFTGFALLTGSLWALAVPIVMTLGFIFMHIPKLDKYLAERYDTQFSDYAAKTKKLIPWVY